MVLDSAYAGRSEPRPYNGTAMPWPYDWLGGGDLVVKAARARRTPKEGR
jgi:hypothetical protein